MSRRKQDRTLAPACHLRTGTGRRRRRRIREREEMLRETGMAEVNGARIYYEAAGEGDPLVLVHAGIADSRMWEDQLMAFADRYRVIRHDMRGFGTTACGASGRPRWWRDRSPTTRTCALYSTL